MVTELRTGPDRPSAMHTPSHPAASNVDPALLNRVVKGDVQAFGQLYDQSSTLLYTLALKILGNRDDAADVLQEVYLEVWRKVARYDVGRGTPIAWLITLTRSRAIDRLRARHIREQRVAATPLDEAPPIPDRGPTPYEAQADQELRVTVAEALTALPQPQQQALELAYYEGLTHAEIAEKLHLPLGTVKTRIKLALSKLRDALRPYWNHGESV